MLKRAHLPCTSRPRGCPRPRPCPHPRPRPRSRPIPFPNLRPRRLRGYTKLGYYCKGCAWPSVQASPRPTDPPLQNRHRHHRGGAPSPKQRPSGALALPVAGRYNQQARGQPTAHGTCFVFRAAMSVGTHGRSPLAVVPLQNRSASSPVTCSSRAYRHRHRHRHRHKHRVQNQSAYRQL